jgi:hypothetical protein
MTNQKSCETLDAAVLELLSNLVYDHQAASLPD